MIIALESLIKCKWLSRTLAIFIVLIGFLAIKYALAQEDILWDQLDLPKNKEVNKVSLSWIGETRTDTFHIEIELQLDTPQIDLNDSPPKILLYPNPYRPNDGNWNTGSPYQESDSLSGIIFEFPSYDITIDIYNVLGELVNKYKSKHLQRFRFAPVDFNGNMLPSGIYIYTLDFNTTPPYIKTGKFAVIKEKN